jgi:hypothetical protein
MLLPQNLQNRKSFLPTTTTFSHTNSAIAAVLQDRLTIRDRPSRFEAFNDSGCAIRKAGLSELATIETAAGAAYDSRRLPASI